MGIRKVKKFHICGVPIMAQWKQSMRTQVQSLDTLNGLRIRHCVVGCRQGSDLAGVAVAMV